MTSNVTLPPAHEMQSSYSPNQWAYQQQGPHYNSAPYRGPTGGASSLPMYQGSPEVWNAPSTTSSYYGSSPGRGISHNVSHQWLPNNNGRGRGWQQGRGPYTDPGRGLGMQTHQWRGGSTQSGFRSGGRGQGRGFQARGFQSRGSAPDEALGPECFYDRSMMEDPWQNLEPVLWKPLDDSTNNLNRSGSSKPWLPHSISTKKPRLSEPSNKSTTQQSLAAYLSASFNEALDESPSV